MVQPESADAAWRELTYRQSRLLAFIALAASGFIASVQLDFQILNYPRLLSSFWISVTVGYAVDAFVSGVIVAVISELSAVFALEIGLLPDPPSGTWLSRTTRRAQSIFRDAIAGKPGFLLRVIRWFVGGGVVLFMAALFSLTTEVLIHGGLIGRLTAL